MNWLRVCQCHGKKQHSVQILALVGKSSKTQDDAENQQESVMHEQPIQLVMVLIIHVDALPE